MVAEIVSGFVSHPAKNFPDHIKWTLTWTRREGVLDHMTWKFFARGQRTFLVRSRDTNSLPAGAELLCPSRDGRSP